MRNVERFLRISLRMCLPLWFATAAGFLAAASPPTEGTSREYALKAALLFNFPHFVEWPAMTFAQPDSPLVIGVLGRDPFGDVLDKMVRGETFDGRTLRIERYRNVEAAAEHAQILFISTSERAELPRILRVLRTRPILTVAEMDDFDAQGGMIRLVKSPANKIQLRINLESCKNAGLTVSAKLLRLDETAAAGN